MCAIILTDGILLLASRDKVYLRIHLGPSQSCDCTVSLYHPVVNISENCVNGRAGNSYS